MSISTSSFEGKRATYNREYLENETRLDLASIPIEKGKMEVKKNERSRR